MPAIRNELVLVARPIRGCAIVTLNRPKAANALSRALRREFSIALDRLIVDGETRVLVLTGAGTTFCAGLDLKELALGDVLDGVLSDRVDENPIAALGRFQGPVIGAINGAAVTGGFELALACDMLIASTDARFADTHAVVGVMPGWGMSQLLPRTIGVRRAKELALTGRSLSAANAETWGLVNRVVPPAELLPQALGLAQEMLLVTPEMLMSYKRVIDDGMAGGLSDGLRLERCHARLWAESKGLFAPFPQDRLRGR